MKKEEIINRFEDNLEEVLFDLYITEKLSTTKIAEYFSNHFGERVGCGSIWLLLKHFNIATRSISEAVSEATSFLDYDKKYIDANLLRVIDGLLLSDGCLLKGGKFHRFSIGSSSKEFIDYCFKQLKSVCTETPPKQYTDSNKEYKNGRKPSWSFCSCTHPDFTIHYNRWYKDFKKIIPRDVSISPTSLLLWYYGDGTIINSGNSCTVRIATDAFTREDIDWFANKIKEETGIVFVRNSENRMKLKTESIPDFFNYIGRKPELSTYAYKFEVADWRFDMPMKKACQILDIPYNRLSHLVKTNAIEYNRSSGGKKVVFSKEQIERLRTANKNGLLMADARISNFAITKGKFNKIPVSIKDKINEIRSIGFPIVKLSEDNINSEFNNFYNVPMISINDQGDFDANYRNNDLVIHFHPHLFSVKCGEDRSPMEAYLDDEMLSDIVSKMIDKREALDGKNLRNRICSYHGVKRTSVFPIRVAKTLIAKYGKKDMKFLDPCAGYSSRLVGFMGQGFSGKYIGIEPCVTTCEGLINTTTYLKKFDNGNHEIQIINGCAEDVMPTLEESGFDFIFTSPPYFNIEKYSGEETQSYIRYPEYERWKNDFLFKMISEAKRLLKPKGTFLLNVSNAREHKIIEDVDDFAKKIFRVENVLIMHSPSKWLEKISEPIFVLKKD